MPILEPLTKNEFTLKNSYEFANCLKDKNYSNITIASFDIESLFTNIPLEETIEIIIKSFFKDNIIFMGFTKDIFRRLLNLAVKGCIFIFNGILFEQIEGLGMGLPLGPTFANIFLCYWEKIWLRDCPKEFKPILYKRYLDDTFLVFNNLDQIDKFLQYLNNQHQSIKFTADIENNNKLAYLDVLIEKDNDKFKTSVYRKKTFTGLGISFFSFDICKFKFNAIRTLIYRAFNISSNYNIFHKELEFLKIFFINNGFPLRMINNEIKRFLDNIYNKRTPVTTVSKLPIYVKMPYLGKYSDKMKFDIKELLNNYLGFVNLNILFVNNHKLGNYFRYKERLPTCNRSMLIYKFCCAHCSASYVGSTKLTLLSRVDQHAGRSSRTGRYLAHPVFSHIRNHCENNCG